MPDRLSADQALSAVAVLEPGDTVKLAAVVPAATAAAAAAGQHHSPAQGSAAAGAAGAPVAAAAASSGAAVAADLKDLPRLAAAEVLVGRLVVCWEMITGAAAAGVLPHGYVPLEPLDVAANLTPGTCL